MNRDLLQGLRKSCVWMGFFAATFVLMYLGIVLSSKFVYVYFMGFIPDANRNLLRVIFYGMSSGSAGLLFLIKKKRYSRESLKPVVKDNYRLAKSLMMTSVISMSIAEVPLICGFFMFFLSAMYMDFYILAATSIILIITNVPKVESWEESIKEAES